MTADMDLVTLMRAYDTDEECRDLLERLRWPEGMRCPRCQGERIRRTESRKQFDCWSCGYQFSVTAGTIFHDSHLPLPIWFTATYLMVESKKGISALQMQRTLGIKTYKTAWYLCHRIRAAMTEAQLEHLNGIVEVDETYIGGKVRGKGKGYIGNKAIVVGAVQRKGKIILTVVDSTDKKTLQGFVKAHTAPDTEAIHTDEHASYVGIEDENTRHETVHHKSEEYVRHGPNGIVHTNSVENVWSLLDRSIMGSFHHVSLKHLDAYLDELEWRFNNREAPHLFRDTLIKLITADNLPYRNLTAEVLTLAKPTGDSVLA